MKIDCLFCKIVQGQIPATKVFENETVLGFVDIHPQAKKHFLFIHKNHTKNIVDMMDFNPDDVKELYAGITEFAKSQDHFTDGMRIVTNMGPHAGQTVFHTHFHVLGGEQLGHFGK
jgi:histidine triad (HIT) family protein